jgi:hypothetical protein
MTAHLSRRSLLRAAPALAVPITLAAPLPALAAIPAPWRPEPRPGLPAVEDRIAAICEWFDLEPPALAPGEDVLESEAGLDWMIASGVSLDWLVLGDVHGLVIAFRNDELQQRASLAAQSI